MHYGCSLPHIHIYIYVYIYIYIYIYIHICVCVCVGSVIWFGVSSRLSLYIYVVTETIMYQNHISCKITERLKNDTHIEGFHKTYTYTAQGWDG